MNGRVEQGMKKNEGGGKEKKGALGVFFSFFLSFFFFFSVLPCLFLPTSLPPASNTAAAVSLWGNGSVAEGQKNTDYEN